MFTTVNGHRAAAVLFSRPRSAFEALESRDLLTAVVVDTVNDVVDGDTTSVPNLKANPGADQKISLCEAITAANTNADPADVNRNNAVGFAEFVLLALNFSFTSPWVDAVRRRHGCRR